jgi:hypothetical protein
MNTPRSPFKGTIRKSIGCRVLFTSISETTPERKLALIHRVIIPAQDYPKEYAVLVTDRRSIFILQEKTRSNFVLRREMSYGTALITDVVPKTLEDYEQNNPDSLSQDAANMTIPHNAIISLALKKDARKTGRLNLFVRLTMMLQKEDFQVYNIEMNFWADQNRKEMIKLYMVPLGAYFKPKRQTQNRDTILREYALENLEIFRKVLSDKIS